MLHLKRSLYMSSLTHSLVENVGIHQFFVRAVSRYLEEKYEWGCEHNWINLRRGLNKKISRFMDRNPECKKICVKCGIAE